MKPTIYVTRRLPQACLDKICGYFSMEINPDDRVLRKEEVIKGARNKDALLCLLTDAIDAEIMEACPKLRVISNYAVGFNNIDVVAASKRKIPVCNTPGVLTETTADMAWALMLSIARRIPESDRFTRAGKFQGWGPLMFLGTDIFGKTLGIVGMGRIGQAVARRAAGFSMRVLYCNDEQPVQLDQAIQAEMTDFNTVLLESDFVSLHVPMGPATKHLIGAQQLKSMKKTAYLINTARGPVVDEKALVQALMNGVIAGAALDVYEEEPKLAPGLIELENVILAPHTASATIETRTKMGLLAAENAIAIFEKKLPHAIVNPEVLRV